MATHNHTIYRYVPAVFSHGLTLTFYDEAAGEDPETLTQTFVLTYRTCATSQDHVQTSVKV